VRGEGIYVNQFVGRSQELQFLKEYYDREGSQILVVYGGRGVGKTALLKEFCRGRKSSYYLARACSSREQRFQWAAELKEKGVDIGRYPEYDELFENMAEHKELSKQVIVIDEFHFLIKGDSAFFDALIRYVENRLLSRPVMVALMTSASGWVENTMIGKVGHSAAAISGWMKVRQMPIKELCKLFPGYSRDDYVGNYAVLGGYPGLWKNFSQELTTQENIIQNILRPESRLREQTELFLSEELREPAVYGTILATLARDCNKLNDIYRHTGFSRAKISVYLKNLMEIDMVEKVASYDTAGRENTQKGIYRISNPYVRFYFRYLFSGMSLLQQLTPEEFYRRRIEPTFGLFAEEAYRKICREQLGQTHRSVGEWIGKVGSIDIIAADASGNLTVASCSYSRRMTNEDLEWLLFCMKKARVVSRDVRLYCEKGFDVSLRGAVEEGRVRLWKTSLHEGR